MSFKDKLSDRNISDKEWRIFERHMTKWLSDNSRNLTNEEGKHFRRTTAICIGAGVSTGCFTNFVLHRLNVFPNRLTRILFSTFGGVYTSAFTINSLRKSVYLKLLDSTGPAGFASRKILESTKELDLEHNYIDPIYLPKTHRSNPPASGVSSTYSPARETTHSTANKYTPPTNTYMDNTYSPNTDTFGSSSVYPAGPSNVNPEDSSPSLDKKYKTWEEIRRSGE